MKKKKENWNQDLFKSNWLRADNNSVIERIKGNELQENFKLETNKTYTLFQNLFGVKIESGSIRLMKVSQDIAVDILNFFIGIEVKKGRMEYKPYNEFERVKKAAEKFGLEKPDLQSVQGYLLNNEFVQVFREEFDEIRLKYKDKPENIFYLYRLYFTEFRDQLFLVIEKDLS